MNRIKPFLTWQFFIGVFIGLIIGSTLSLFLYMKNLDIGRIKKDQKLIIQEQQIINKKQDVIIKIFWKIKKEREATEEILEWNKKAFQYEPKEEEHEIEN